MALTADQMRALLERYKDSRLEELTNDIFLDWANFINNYVYDLYECVAPKEKLSETTISIVSGTSSYSLPADFDSVDTDSCGMYYVDSNGTVLDTRLALTGYGSQTLGYYIQGSNIYITPEPQDSSTYKLRYIPKLTELSAMSDATVIESKYKFQVLEVLKLMYTLWASEEPIFDDVNVMSKLDALSDSISPEPMIYSMQIINPY